MSSSALLRSTIFRREREATWERLEHLVARVERRGLGSLEPRELAELPTIYRATMSSLGMARAISLDRNLLEHLDSLAQRAWCAFYAPSRSWRQRLGEWLLVGFPTSVRSMALPLLVATLTLLAGVGIGHGITAADNEMFYAFVPEAYAQGRNTTASREDLREGLYAGEHHHGSLAQFASMLIVNNTGVGLLIVALGFLAGLPALLLLLFNGLLLGAMSAVFSAHGLGLDFWAWVLPHGVTELLAILLCGAASMAIGGSLLGILFGLVFMLVGLAFKVSAVPFHMWTPDVYEGSPTPVTAFFATAPKVAAMALIARLVFDAFGQVIGDWSQIVAALAVMSMFLGSIAGIADIARATAGGKDKG